MGGGLLQKVNRDTMSFATKLSHVVYADGTEADIMKSPTGDTSKISFPGDALSPSASRSVSECISSQCLRVKCHVQCLNHASDFLFFPETPRPYAACPSQMLL